MQVYTPVLREICKDLRSLTLHIGFDDESVNMTGVGKSAQRFDCIEDDNVREDNGKSDEEKLNRIVSRVVRELKGLQHLQLGDFKKVDIPTDDIKWGKAAKWMEIVRRRAEGVDVAGEYAGLGDMGNRRAVRNRGNGRVGYQNGRGGRGNWARS